MEPTTKLVSDDRLGHTKDGYLDTTLDGKLFSGISLEEDEGTKVIIGISGYTFGKLHGPLRSWDLSGRLRMEAYYNNGGFHGPRRKWHENGRPNLDAYFEHGFPLREKRWDENGNLLSEERMDETHPRWAKLQEARARAQARDGGPIVDIDQDRWEFFERPPGWGREESEVPPPPAPPAPPPHR